MSRSMSDLVRDSRIDTRFLPDTAVVHTYTTSDLGVRQRRSSREETWREEQSLGGGNFGKVWLQRCSDGQRRGQLRAVKEVPKGNGSAVDYTRELEAIAKFSHKKYRHCFVESYGWYEHDTSMFITMEFLEHGDLQRYLDRPFPESQAQEIASQLIEGADFMHENGFAHRDLKPQNILVVHPQPAWWVKIGDFGFSKRTIGMELTSTVGTHSYKAPELRFRGQQPSYGVAVDIWAVGQITFQMITNRLAFSGDDAGDDSDLFRYYTQSRQFPETLLVRRHASPRCCQFIKNTMAALPDDRPKARDLVRHDWLTGTSPSMERPPQTDNELSFIPATSNLLQDQDSVHTDPSTSWSSDDEPTGTSSRELTSLSTPRSIEYTEKLNNAAIEGSWPLQTKRDTILQTDAPAGRFLLRDHHTASESENRVVIGLEFGTTSCSMAYAFDRFDPRPIIEWPGAASGRTTPFVPTVIAYDESADNKPFKWGAQVDWEKDAVMGANPYQPNQSDRSGKIKGQLTKVRKESVHVAADFISAMCEYALSLIESKVPRGYLRLYHLQFVLSYPYNCSEQAKHRILRAANMAGLHPMTLINELVAAALYALHEYRRTLFVGDAFVVCDAGDRTINLTACEVMNMVPYLELEEIGPGSSGVPGSIILNTRFAEAVENIVGNEQWYRLSKSRAWARAEKEFNTYVKKEFTGDVDEEYFINFPNANLEDNPQMNIKRDSWTLLGKDVKRIFDPLVQDILRGIDDQIKRAILKRQGRGIKGIILIGEFGSNEYLASCIKRECLNMEVIQPVNSMLAIANGAVLAGFS